MLVGLKRLIKIQKNEDHLNGFLKVEKNSLLTLNEINILPFSELDEKIFNGDYHIKGSPQDIDNFILGKAEVGKLLY